MSGRDARICGRWVGAANGATRVPTCRRCATREPVRDPDPAGLRLPGPLVLAEAVRLLHRQFALARVHRGSGDPRLRRRRQPPVPARSTDVWARRLASRLTRRSSTSTTEHDRWPTSLTRSSNSAARRRPFSSAPGASPRADARGERGRFTLVSPWSSPGRPAPRSLCATDGSVRLSRLFDGTGTARRGEGAEGVARASRRDGRLAPGPAPALPRAAPRSGGGAPDARGVAPRRSGLAAVPVGSVTHPYRRPRQRPRAARRAGLRCARAAAVAPDAGPLTADRPAETAGARPRHPQPGNRRGAPRGRGQSDLLDLVRCSTTARSPAASSGTATSPPGRGVRRGARPGGRRSYRLYLDAHASIAFAAGWALSPRRRCPGPVRPRSPCPWPAMAGPGRPALRRGRGRRRRLRWPGHRRRRQRHPRRPHRRDGAGRASLPRSPGVELRVPEPGPASVADGAHADALAAVGAAAHPGSLLVDETGGPACTCSPRRRTASCSSSAPRPPLGPTTVYEFEFENPHRGYTPGITVPITSDGGLIAVSAIPSYFAGFLAEIRLTDPAGKGVPRTHTGSCAPSWLADEADPLARSSVDAFLQGQLPPPHGLRPLDPDEVRGPRRRRSRGRDEPGPRGSATAPTKVVERFRAVSRPALPGAWITERPVDRDLVRGEPVTIDLVSTAAPSRSERETFGEAVGHARALARSADASRRHRAGPGDLGDRSVVPGGDRGCGPKGDRHRDVAGEPLQIPRRGCSSRWVPTHPIAQIEWTEGKGARTTATSQRRQVPQVVAQPPRRPRVPEGLPARAPRRRNCPDRVESVAEGRDQVARGDRRAVRPRRAHGRQAGAARPRGPRERRVPARDGRGLRRLLRHGRRGCGPRPPGARRADGPRERPPVARAVGPCSSRRPPTTAGLPGARRSAPSRARAGMADPPAALRAGRRTLEEVEGVRVVSDWELDRPGHWRLEVELAPGPLGSVGRCRP